MRFEKLLRGVSRDSVGGDGFRVRKVGKGLQGEKGKRLLRTTRIPLTRGNEGWYALGKSTKSKGKEKDDYGLGGPQNAQEIKK